MSSSGSVMVSGVCVVGRLRCGLVGRLGRLVLLVDDAGCIRWVCRVG